ncbi:DUF262 domain-containing protein [Rhizobium leguminosarum]|uniref:DUF262 domain-containing protein n=1 Tax=Rhizobium leguminosarum TaxID=384 RepID=A0A7K3VD16_RHILE|nr:DUF262 domain-containing protein [Rhizobium leguminosarum]NEK15030.1 DUF262 domain-containing protein [Rhizobium leguminosarum]
MATVRCISIAEMHLWRTLNQGIISSMETIKAAEKALKDVFCDQYIFRIPPYQRPYSWTEEQAAELLDDLKWAAGDEKPIEKPPYFLGSIVVIKDPDYPDADIVDGQQRITTLTILMSVLRELATTDQQRANINIFLSQKGNPLLGTRDIPRLTIRKRDADFFRKCIQDGDQGGILDAANTDARKRMIANRDFYQKKLGEMSEEERNHLLAFAVQRCYLVVVEASDQASAYRIFSVMNDRGLDLTATDILKSDIIGAIETDTEQDSYNAKWEALEDGLGRQAFVDLFAHLRMIHRKQKMRGTLEREFRDYVKPIANPQHFIDEELRPSAEVFEQILSPHAANLTRYRLLKGLQQLDNQDWQPPAIKFLVDYHTNETTIIKFLERLDRLAYFLFITRANVNERLLRYAAVLGEIENGAVMNADSRLDLSNGEKAELRHALDGDIYSNQRTRKPILLRLDAMLSDGTAHYDHALITIEHVLPQNPAVGSDWLNNFADTRTRNAWVHRLANLVLLSKYKNPAASTYDFDRKKTIYFADNGDTPFILTSQVRQEPVWTLEVLRERQARLLKRISDVWCLGEDAQPVTPRYSDVIL